MVLNAKALATGLSKRELSLVSGGTDNHLILVDLRPSHPDLTGKVAQNALEKANITLNRNTVPGETRSPFQASGLRIGSPAITTRGFKQEEVTLLPAWMCEILEDIENQSKAIEIKSKVLELCSRFPVYQ